MAFTLYIVYSQKVHVFRPVVCLQYTFALFLQLYASVKLKMEEMQQHMSWIEVQFLKKAVDVLCLCRQTLMFTYVFAFYLKKNNQSIIFEVKHVYRVYQWSDVAIYLICLTVLFGSCSITMLVIALFALCVFYAQRCSYKEVQAFSNKFH